jgi:insertion element IS1 protein InsB
MHWAIGAGKTCQRLWEAIPLAYRQGHCFTDFWAAYMAVIPEEQHTAGGKETGETAHVERWNNTLRQRLAFICNWSSIYHILLTYTTTCSFVPLPTVRREGRIIHHQEGQYLNFCHVTTTE